MSKLYFDVNSKPSISQTIVFAFQQILAIMAATIAVPAIIGNGLTPAAALFGAGCGTLVYILFTKRKSPVFLGSSFAFIKSMFACFAGAATMALGWLGLIFGAVFAGLVYVVISLLIKFFGTEWINKLMPAVVIGPTVAIIGLSLAGNAIGDLTTGDVTHQVTEYVVAYNEANEAVLEETTVNVMTGSVYVALICGLVALFTTMIVSTYGKKMAKLIPFIIGIGAGYLVALIFTLIGLAGVDAFKILDFGVFGRYMLTDGHITFKSFLSVPDLIFIKAFGAFGDLSFGYILTVFVAYVPVAFVTFAEHLADHKNLSTIIDHDLTTDPGLDKTLLGDGIGSMAGAFFGGCPNTTYGESVATVAITKNASVITIIFAAIGCILLSFITPLVALIDSIPTCVMGGVCVALYGFISVSGLKMIQGVDLGKNVNLFTVSVILIGGIGGLTLSFGQVTLTEVACALILGIVTFAILKKEKDSQEEPATEAAASESLETEALEAPQE